MISRTMRGAMYAGSFLGNSTVWRYAKKRGLWYYRLLLSNRFADVMSDIFEMTELEKKLNEQIEKNASMKSDNSKLVRESVFSQACSDLTDTEAEKFKGLVEDVEFTDEDSFKEKLDTLKESYFPKAKTVAESVDSETNTGSESYETGAMAAYMDAISRNVPAKAVEK